MKKIQLYTAAPDKNGIRREAGEILTVGTGKTDDLLLEEAKALVGRAAAVVKEFGAKPKPKAPAQKSKASKPTALATTTTSTSATALPTASE